MRRWGTAGAIAGLLCLLFALNMSPTGSPGWHAVGIPTFPKPAAAHRTEVAGDALPPLHPVKAETAVEPIASTFGPRTLLGRERIVAYYGVAGNGALGELGAAPPERIARVVKQRAAAYREFGKPVQPAMELVATIAQASPGADGNYSHPISNSTIRHYLTVAHKQHMLLILDLQPGHASYLSQARALRQFLVDPSVELGLDPEWQVTWGAPGGGRVGRSPAHGINAVAAYMSKLIRSHHLPDKLLLVHQFTAGMLPDRNRITTHAGVEMLLHADGAGPADLKAKVFRQLEFPASFGTGIGLFVHLDPGMMTPREVMQLRPLPDLITYQ